ncbi:MAG: hypothetical protein H7336_09760 [Bacteriovorax sp.]|nr:hypothetical protein [Bacteriovorax sp.]
MSEFFQNGPTLKNQFEDDQLLKSYIDEKIPVMAFRIGDLVSHVAWLRSLQFNKSEY